MVLGVEFWNLEHSDREMNWRADSLLGHKNLGYDRIYNR